MTLALQHVVCVAASFAVTFGGGTARADDWLAVLPECAGERASAAAAELLYPRHGLPALVPAGETLVVRARLALPLTPPPGVQQERALEGLAATLIGHARDLRPEPSEQRIELPVVNVRPEGASSLRYRLRVPVPAWLAPGTYDFELSAKGTSMRTRSSVRVLAQGAQPQLIRLRDDSVEQLRASSGNIDTFVDLDDVSRRGGSGPQPSTAPRLDALLAAAPPILRTAGLRAALRVGPRLWVVGSCEAPHLPFEVEVASVLRAEQRERLADFAVPVDQPSAGSPGSSSRAARSMHPAGELRVAPQALVVRLADGGNVLQRVATAPLQAQLIVQPNPARSGEPVRASVRADRALSALALRFDHLHTAYTLQPVEHRYRALGTHRIDGLAIAADGTAVALHAEVSVRTARASGGWSCAARPVASHPVWASQGLWLAALLLKRRGRRAAGNRLGADPRSA